jgi:hypothetical protein
MKFWKRFTEHFSSRGKALWLYRRGMARAKLRQHRGAIEDYTATLNMTATPKDVRAMVLYNRALVHVAIGGQPQAIEDLERLLAMEDAPAKVKAMAKQKLARMDSRSRKSKA